jgi:amino acid transporter
MHLCPNDYQGDFVESAEARADDIKTLHRLGYAQELLRRMSGFSNFAISLSIICILAGGITSFQQGLCSVGGASIGLGWPIVCLFSLAVAAAMAQIASAFPTTGGLYHWASILGGRGWGWTTAWFNLIGLVSVLAAINVGAYEFLASTVLPQFGLYPQALPEAVQWDIKIFWVALVTLSQALFNHLGIRIVSWLTDFSGYLILVVSLALTAALLYWSQSLDFSRLVTFTNYSFVPESNPVWPKTANLAWLFLLGFLLPAYTVSGFDASAHTSEETVEASHNVPKGIVRSVLVSGIFGWIMLSAAILAAPSLDAAAEQGGDAFGWIMHEVLPTRLTQALVLGIALAQYLCGLATVTSASRMLFAFARDGGLPYSPWLRHVSPSRRTPPAAVWTAAIAALLFCLYTPVDTTIAAVCTICLYVSYALPIGLGFAAYGRSWTQMGPWSLGGWYKPLAGISVAGCLVLIAVGMAPPNEMSFGILLTFGVVLAILWFAFERRRFPGPPVSGFDPGRQQAIRQAELAIGESPV